MDTEKLDYFENMAVEHLRETIGTIDDMKREAGLLLNILLAGGAGAATMVLHEQGRWAITAGATAAYLFVLAVVLNWKCLMRGSAPSLWNEPGKLPSPFKETLTLQKIREFELENIQGRITEAHTLADRRAFWMNRCRMAAVATLLVAAVAWALAG